METLKASNENGKMEEVKSAMKMSESKSTAMLRERSFIRTSNNQNNIKRRSLALNMQAGIPTQFPNQNRGKPDIDIYRPPKMNYNVQHSASSIIFPAPPNMLQHSKSSTSIQQMHMLGGHGLSIPNVGHRTILVPHPLHLNQLGLGVAIQPTSVPMTPHHRVKFSQEYQIPTHVHAQSQQNHNAFQQSIQRSKSLSAADALLRSCEGLGTFDNEAEIGKFPTEVQNVIRKALQNPNELNTRVLIELTHHIMQRAVEGRRYALPMSRLCMAIIAKETKETFLEALLNTCRQWYQEREKALYSIQGMKSPARTRFTSYMSFLTEMFCHLKRWNLQFQHYEGESPHFILLSLLLKCCQDCVKPPVRSLAEIECLFYVLTCVGRDLETHLPRELEALLSSVRDAFLNSTAPNIRRTLLQLIELQASRWQLPGNTVLYYYPSAK